MQSELVTFADNIARVASYQVEHGQEWVPHILGSDGFSRKPKLCKIILSDNWIPA